jgi:4-amino-4-deoxy-L-arabinose transferase-like glycosyltransferase
VLLLITALIVTAFYVNHPRPEVDPDTPSYLAAARNILAHGQLTDPMRLPGYPLLIAAVFLLAGRDNVAAVSMVQGALFVLVTLEVYALAWLVFRRTRVAFTVGLLVGANMYLLSSFKYLMSEALATWLVTTLALVTVLCVRRMQRRYLWALAALLLALFMTRPEWIYAPVPLMAYLLLIAARRRRFVRLLPHALLAVAMLYLVLGLYVYENGRQTGFAGLTQVQSVNLLGKVMQYHMQTEAPARYATEARIVNAYMTAPGYQPVEAWASEPWIVAGRDPLARNHYALTKAYAVAIIMHDPVAFLLHSTRLAVVTLPDHDLFMVSARNRLFGLPLAFERDGPFAIPLALLQACAGVEYGVYLLFPICVVVWGLMLIRPGTGSRHAAEVMGVLVLLALYDIVLVALGGYSSYGRLHAPVLPLLTAVVWGSILVGGMYVVPGRRRVALDARPDPM